MKILKNTGKLVVSLSLALVVSRSQTMAQDSCLTDEVILPAIQDAADENECTADGAYITVSAFLDKAIEQYSTQSKRNGESEGNSCQKFFNNKMRQSITLMKGLAKAGFFESSEVNDLRDSFKETIQDLCVNKVDPDEGDNEDGDGEHNTPTPTPSSNNGENQARLDYILQKTKEHCGCNSGNRQSDLICFQEYLGAILSDGKITQSQKNSLFSELANSCATPELN